MDNFQLDKTLTVDGITYNINAVNAETADKVQKAITFIKSLLPTTEGVKSTETIIFDGSEAREIGFVPSSGGEFTGAVYIPSKDENSTINDREVVNYGDLKNIVVADALEQLQNSSVLYSWDGTNLEGSNENPEINTVCIVTGKEEHLDELTTWLANNKKFYAYFYIATDTESTDEDGDRICNIYFGTLTSGVYKVKVNAETADTLTVARKIGVDLASNQPGEFDGSADVNIGVSGILSVEHGGTGKANLDEVEVGSAKKLATTQKLYVDLNTYSTGTSFDGSSENPTAIGVSGVLPENRGGTGVISLSNATVGNADGLTVYSSTEKGKTAKYSVNSKIIVSANAPTISDGNNGDIWIQLST